MFLIKFVTEAYKNSYGSICGESERRTHYEEWNDEEKAKKSYQEIQLAKSFGDKVISVVMYKCEKV